jgi:putative acetyltransferase
VDDGTISAADPRSAEVRRLLERHLAFAHAQVPPEDRHALDVNGLTDPSVTFYGLRVDGELLAVGALKRLDDEHAELKSMHTAEAARRRGLGRSMLGHLLRVAHDRGFRRVSIETGSFAAFAPARALYASAGFTECGSFGNYGASPNTTFMTLQLSSAPVAAGALLLRLQQHAAERGAAFDVLVGGRGLGQRKRPVDHDSEPSGVSSGSGTSS